MPMQLSVSAAVCVDDAAGREGCVGWWALVHLQGDKNRSSLSSLSPATEVANLRWLLRCCLLRTTSHATRYTIHARRVPRAAIVSFGSPPRLFTKIGGGVDYQEMCPQAGSKGPGRVFRFVGRVLGRGEGASAATVDFNTELIETIDRPDENLPRPRRPTERIRTRPCRRVVFRAGVPATSRRR